MPIRFFFFFNDTATTEIYTLSLHDALPISRQFCLTQRSRVSECRIGRWPVERPAYDDGRSEEHTSELQSQSNLVCRLLLEKKKKKSMHTWQFVLNISLKQIAHVRRRDSCRV